MDEHEPAKSWLPDFLRPSKPMPSPPPSNPDSPTETSSLLPKKNGNDDSPPSSTLPPSETGELDDYPSKGLTTRLVLREFLLVLRSSLPVVLAYALQNSLQTVSVLIVGRSSPQNLATAAFAYMFAMSTGWLIGLGGSTALDTLASSAFTGSKNPYDLGVLLQRSFIVLGLFYIPVVVLWYCSEWVFLALGQEEQIARDASRFLMVLAPGGLGYIYFEAMKKYLQAQEIMRPGTYILLLTSPINALLNYLLIGPFGLGLLGAPLATGISYWLSFLGLALYATYVHGHEAWGGWSRACLHNMGTFARLAFLGLVSVGTEWWAFEIVALVAGQLGTISLAAQSVIMTSDQVMNTIPFGVGVAASARVGNLLGARDARGAARAAQCAAWLAMLLGGVVLVILMASREHFAKLFNSDPRVVSLTAEVLPFVALFQIADGLNGSCAGSLRGMGRQHIAAVVNIVSYYCLALPLGIWMAWHGWGLKGLWVGQCLALYLVGFLEWGVVAWSNWEKEVEKAFGRMDAGRDGTKGDDETQSGALDGASDGKSKGDSGKDGRRESVHEPTRAASSSSVESAP